MLLAQRVVLQDSETGHSPDAPSLLQADRLAAQAETIRAIVSGRADSAALFPKERQCVERGDTTHISAIDGDGMVVSITTSIGPNFGSAVAASGGYLMAHSYQMGRGRRVADRDITHMLPTILVSPEGDRLGLGAAGAETIQAQCCAPWSTSGMCDL